jgi:hypothetical protein
VLIGLDEFQPAIPWQVALQQSLPPLSRPRAILQNKTSPYNDFAANGDNLLNFVSQPKGAVQSLTLPVRNLRGRNELFRSRGRDWDNVIKNAENDLEQMTRVQIQIKHNCSLST